MGPNTETAYHTQHCAAKERSLWDQLMVTRWCLVRKRFKGIWIKRRLALVLTSTLSAMEGKVFGLPLMNCGWSDMIPFQSCDGYLWLFTLWVGCLLFTLVVVWHLVVHVFGGWHLLFTLVVVVIEILWFIVVELAWSCSVGT